MSTRKICIEVTRESDGGGYLYVVFTEHGEDYVLIASGQEDSLATVYKTIQSVTERNL